MPTSFLQLELLVTGGPLQVAVGENIPFSPQRAPSHQGSDSLLYDDQFAQIKILQPGLYFVNWFVSTQTGLSTNGNNFELTTPGTHPDFQGSSHVKITPASGFGLISVTKEQLGAAGGIFAMSLTNQGNAAATLAGASGNVVAGLAIFDVTEAGTGNTRDESLYPMVQAQSSVSDMGLGGHIPDGAPITFTQKLDEWGEYVDLEPATGSVIIALPGKYQVGWQVPIETTDTSESIVLALYNGVNLHSRAALPLPTGNLTGTAIVTISPEAPLLGMNRIRLVNASGNTIRITDYANLTLVRLA